METSARQQAANAAIGLLQQMGTQSKAAAQAAILLNRGLAIAQIIQNTSVARMRAMAELGPIAGPPVAAKIGVMGKIQAGVAAAAGLMQAASVGGGSSAAGSAVGQAAQSAQATGGTGGASGASAARAQNVTIQLQGEVFGRDQVRSLITQINEAVADGSVLRLA